MQYLDWITALLQELELKDILTLIVSSFSLVVAGIALLYTVVSKRRELAISVRNDLHDCIFKLSENKVEFENLRRRLGEDYPSGLRPRRLRCSPPPLLSPILFGLALHRRCRRALHLEPVGRAPAAGARAEPLADDALEAHLAGVAEHHL